MGARGPGGARWKGRVAQKRRVLLPPQQHNSALLCCTETESEQADLHIANSHHYVFNKAAAVRLRKVLNKAAAPATRGNLRIPGKEAGTLFLYNRPQTTQVKEENSIQTRSVQNKRALVTIV